MSCKEVGIEEYFEDEALPPETPSYLRDWAYIRETPPLISPSVDMFVRGLITGMTLGVLLSALIVVLAR